MGHAAASDAGSSVGRGVREEDELRGADGVRHAVDDGPYGDVRWDHFYGW
jgi:hypothetical protein